MEVTAEIIGDTITHRIEGEVSPGTEPYKVSRILEVKYENNVRPAARYAIREDQYRHNLAILNPQTGEFEDIVRFDKGTGDILEIFGNKWEITSENQVLSDKNLCKRIALSTSTQNGDGHDSMRWIYGIGADVLTLPVSNGGDGGRYVFETLHEDGELVADASIFDSETPESEERMFCEGKEWVVSHEVSYDMSNERFGNNYTETIRVGARTTVEGLECRELISSLTQEAAGYGFDLEGRAYFHFPQDVSSGWYMSCDFNLGAGQRIPKIMGEYVEKCETIMLDGVPAKRLMFGHMEIPEMNCWIEGVGCCLNRGMLPDLNWASLVGPPPSWTGNPDQTRVIKVTVGGKVIFTEEDYYQKDISEVETMTSTPVRPEGIFTLDGKKVPAATPGEVVIINGRKVVM